ncbi:MAG: hypothetical protein RJA57_1243 [Bacteroidota bacterium]|jgi:hypothetical protein
MRKFLFYMIALAFGLTAGAQEPTVPKEPLQVKEISHDFGSIPQGKPVYHFFTLQNTGTDPLKLDDVQVSCGCTTPEWSRDPIAPGGSSRVKVGFNAAAAGHFEKTITLIYQTSKSQILTIKGDVWKAPEGSAPANAAVNLLKKQTF